MPARNTDAAYGSVAKFFHWLLFLLIITMLVYGYLLSYIPKEYAGLAYNTHKLIGLLILTLMVLRALWAFTNPRPPLPQNTLPWQKIAERVVHYGLYAVIFIIPLSGWLGSTAAGKAPHLGDLTFNFPIKFDKATVAPAFDIHEKLAIVLIALISVHVLAALYHHFIRKDDVLLRMLPKIKR